MKFNNLVVQLNIERGFLKARVVQQAADGPRYGQNLLGYLRFKGYLDDEIDQAKTFVQKSLASITNNLEFKQF